MHSDHQRLLVIKHGALGDLLQADGVLRDLRAHYPQAHITLLTTPGFAGLMARCPHVDAVLLDARAPLWQLPRQFSLRRQLRQCQFTGVFDLQSSQRTRLYRQYLLTDVPWVARTQGQAPSSGLQGLVDLLTLARVPVPHARSPDLSWMVTDVAQRLHAAGLSAPYIALIPGASARHPQKRWPYYAQLASLLIQQGCSVVTVLGPDELDLADAMPGVVMHGLNWFELAGVLHQASYVIGNDTGPSHLASGLRRPGLALFGPATSAQRAELARGQFQVLQLTDLHAYTAQQLYQHIAPSLIPIPLPAIPAPLPYGSAG
ncbi:lipopolysaccharide heptosyltransferase family protein [Pseudomethylobacillus aquaticus]|uniref:Lipopolysaccharide heptosyltransferase family protein n=1 Tax=Pseudomethylobacillus aquaticus TaxID=2676064 RepID=A0A3N0UYN1_9PROT|nr:glycosyltransferase family 9 protein [Pseudomethylobacillus aquaticus]ROH85482.1 lipopolysaccharide heptosyltransferase family protein [Pseudomethylobacillus aquaticus]